MASTFGHPPSLLEFWRGLVRAAPPNMPTPFYVFAVDPIREALAELDRHFGHLPIRHWFSCKTQPLAPLLDWWRRQGRPIEVVSDFELRAALQTGFAPSRILVNGPAKHHWLGGHRVPGLNVNFDSVAEAVQLAPLAARLGWTTGLRLNTPEEFDPESPDRPTQFGLSTGEALAALRVLKRHGLRPQILHFHLRTNVRSPAAYRRALQAAAEMAAAIGLAPSVVNCGGGFPPPFVLTRNGTRVDRHFRLPDMARVYERALRWFPQAREIWLENGRWLCARSGVLVTRVLDVKDRRGWRHLICDGGRTLNALVAAWESHELAPLRRCAGRRVPTAVVGPTCMAFDQLAGRPLPAALRAGDLLLWFDAGAYHLQWQTRFSHGLCPVLWHEGGRLERARSKEGFISWWGAIRTRGRRTKKETLGGRRQGGGGRGTPLKKRTATEQDHL